jgi:hypothetical protein
MEEDEYDTGDNNDEIESFREQESLIWSSDDLVKGLLYLTDNYASFKNAGNGGIKIPTVK